MGLQLPSIGAVKSLGHAVLPTAVGGIRDLGKGLEFASQLQLAGLLQPTPVANIIDRVAGDLAAALTKATGDGGNLGAQRTLKRALASALAPPGTSAQRLTEILTTLTRKIPNAGQQNEIAGRLLDAKSAKEPPAQQETKVPSGSAQAEPEAIASFVQTLLKAPPQAPAAPADAQAPAVLPDILARMLARAANADAQRAPAPVAPVAPAPVAPGSNTTQTAPSALFARLVAIITEQHAGTQTDSGGGKQPPQSFPPQSHQVPGSPSSTSTSSLPGQNTASPATQSLTLPQRVPAYVSVDPQAVIEQVVTGMLMRSSGATSELRVRLQPEHLGDVALKLTVTGNTISASLVAQNADVRDMLLANQQHLARSLAQAGLSLSKFSVNVSGGNAGFAGQQGKHHGRSGRPILVGDSRVANEEDALGIQSTGPVSSGPRALVLNYLA